MTTESREIRIVVGDKTVCTFTESEVAEIKVKFDDGESVWTWSGHRLGWTVEGAFADKHGIKNLEELGR